MLSVSFDPQHGWSTPEIKPYENLSLDPASSCLQYATSCFEGMKVTVYVHMYRYYILDHFGRLTSVQMGRSDCSDRSSTWLDCVNLLSAWHYR
jgi:hypothetical protein